MAFICTSVTGSSTADVVYRLKQALKAQGWTVPRSGTTAAYDNTGADLITSGATLAVARAWFECRHPTGLCSFTFQYGTTTTARIKVCFNGDAFSGGAPSANTTGATASATDEYVVCGGGTDAAPTYTAFNGTNTHRDFSCAIENVAPYRFYAWSKGTTANPSMACFFDVLKAGTYDALDTSPYVFYWNGTASNAFGSAVLLSNATTPGSSTCPVAWIGRGIVGGTLSRTLCTGWSDGTSTTFIPGPLEANPVSGRLRVMAVGYGRPVTSFTAPRMFKGISSKMLWKGNYAGAPVANGTRVSVASTNDYVAINDLLVPWDGTVIVGDQSGSAQVLAEGVDLVPGEAPMLGNGDCRPFRAVDETCNVLAPVQLREYLCGEDDE